LISGWYIAQSIENNINIKNKYQDEKSGTKSMSVVQAILNIFDMNIDFTSQNFDTNIGLSGDNIAINQNWNEKNNKISQTEKPIL